MLQGLAGALLLAGGSQAANMNGDYIVSSGDKFGVPFNSDYSSKGHEYFDVWAPEMATHYGEVFWTDQGNQPLPKAIIDRFKGKVMAITGYEQDQVMVIPTGQPGVNPAQDVSVPINWAYNHHYMAWMTGSHSEIKKVPCEPGDAHCETTKNIIVDRPSAANRKYKDVPTGQMFSEGNGGESRKSFHGYPNGFAQLIESPTTWHITPMQIDTRNRDCGATPADVKNCTPGNFGFIPGPEPKQARFGRGIPKGTNYSGVLECPCNGRYGGDPMFYPDSQTRIVEHKYTALSSGTCAAGQTVSDAAACFAAAPTLGINATHWANKSVSDPKLPAACSVTTEADGSATAYYNSPEGKGQCSGGSKRNGAVQSSVGVKLTLDLDGSQLFSRSAKGQYCKNNRADVVKAFPMQDGSLNAAYAARDQCESFCLDEKTCWGCSVDCPSAPVVYGGLLTACQWSALTSCGNIGSWSGSIAGDITEKNPNAEGLVTITASGPASVWFGIGFNASVMSDSPYTLVVNASGVIEQKIGTCGSEAEHCPGDQLAASVKVVSNTVVGSVRTVVMTRGFPGKTSKHYSFGLKATTIPLITAVGSSPVFAYHAAHAGAQIGLTSAGSSTCICDTGIAGKLCEPGGKNCGQFVKNCVPSNPLNYTGASAGDLQAQHNPTCNSAHYVGGLSCCHHKRIMLDADQEIRPELLQYHMKWRFWFQEYKPVNGTVKASHSDLPRIYYQTEANAGEYDIPPAFALPGQPIPGYGKWPEGKMTPGTSCTGTCPDGPDCECEHTITYHWTMSNKRLLYAGGHCHAPACLSIELWKNNTGTPEILCRQLPKYGEGNVHIDKYDEANYLALPPCLWSDKGAEGLLPSVWIPENTPMFSIKRNRNTHIGHFGEMASWQMRGVGFPASTEPDYVI